MKVQSLSIVVPNVPCINHCAYCVSRMRDDKYKNRWNGGIPVDNKAISDYKARLEYARQKGCDTVVITGQCEPQQQMEFLGTVNDLNRQLSSPFVRIEFQTSGTDINEETLKQLRNYGVSTISLSVAAFDDHVNNRYINRPQRDDFGIRVFCNNVIQEGFNLRLSLNLTDWVKDFASTIKGDDTLLDALVRYAKLYGASQLTLRQLFAGKPNTPQYKWINEHSLSSEDISARILPDLMDCPILYDLPSGAYAYDVDGISVLFDGDCMAQKESENIRYYILRPDCKLYTRWDTPASLVF